MLAAPDKSFAHDGMSPHFISDSSRTGSFGFWRMTGIGWGRCVSEDSSHLPLRQRSAPRQPASSATVDSARTLGDYGRWDAVVGCELHRQVHATRSPISDANAVDGVR